MAEEEQEAVGRKSPWPIIALFGLIFLPGGILVGIEWGLLRWGRHRASVVGAISAIVAFLSILIGSLVVKGTVDGISELIQQGALDGQRIGQLALNLVPIWICLSLLLGSPVGYGFAVYSARQMKVSPHLTQLAGSWRHNFKYKRTPLEALRRRRNIRKLKNALLIESERAPMGLDEKTDEVVFRYDSESVKHTFMTGAAGSGKALHGDTWIPTQSGFKRVSRIRVGEIVFDEKGNPAKVSAKFQPLTPDHYELTISNGEVVKACGDHLWPVKVAGGSMQTEIVTTREIAKNPSKYYLSALKNPVLGTVKPLVNTRLLGEWLAGGALAHGHILKRDSSTGQVQEDHTSFVDDLLKMGWVSESGELVKISDNFIFTSIPARERVLSGAISVAGSHGLDGQTKLTLPSRDTAEFLRSLVFSLGIQATPMEVNHGAFSFKFSHKRASQRGKSLFSMTIGEITRKKAPNRGLIRFESVVAIEDSPEDYYCFTVDSPNHQFLFGKTFTPTHNTITMQNLIYADIEAGKDVVVIDFKRSPKFASKLAAWAADNGREFYHFVNGDPEHYDIPRSKGQCYYDPLKSGTATSKADMVLGMREYDTNAAVYKTAMQQLLQSVFNMLKYADRSLAPNIDWTHGGITQLASVVSGNGIGELVAANVKEMPPGSTPYTFLKPGAGGLDGAKEITVNSPNAKEAIQIGEEMRAKGPLSHSKTELQGQMRTIITSEYGRWMKTGSSNEDREIDLFELTSGKKRQGNVILFSLNSDSEPEFAKFVGAMIFSDLTNISALRRNASSENQVNIYVDEFQAVPPSAVTSLLEKSRESKMALTIAQQSFDQVVASAPTAGEAYLNSILDTCSNFIAHAGATERSATRLAEILGKEFVTVYSRMNDNDSSFLSVNWAKNQSSKVSSREEERWKFAPAKFMELSSPDRSNNNKSSAVWITKTSAEATYASKGGATARTVWMVPAENVLIEYYENSLGDRSANTANKTRVVIPAAEEEAIKARSAESSETPTPEVKIEAPHEVRYEDNAEDDEWNFEEIPDDEVEPEDLLVSQQPQEETAKREEYNISDLFSGDAPAPERVTTPKIEEKIEQSSPVEKVSPKLPSLPIVPPRGLPTRPGGGLPLRPGGGLPTRPPKPVARDDSEPSSLPDL